MSNKVFISPDEIKEAAVQLTVALEKDRYEPDLIIAVVRGGLIPAGYVSYYLDQPNVDVIKIQTYVGEEQDLELAEKQEYQLRVDLQNILKKWKPKSILFVDDLIDTGNTLRLIEVNLQAVLNYYKMINEKVNLEEWRYGVLYTVPENEKRLVKKVYSGKEKPEGWLVFPWDTRD